MLTGKKVFQLGFEKARDFQISVWSKSGQINIVADRVVSNPETGIHSLLLSFTTSANSQGEGWIKLADLDILINESTTLSYSQLSKSTMADLINANLVLMNLKKDGTEDGNEFLVPLAEWDELLHKPMKSEREDYQRYSVKLGQYSGAKIKALVVGATNVPQAAQGHCHFDNFVIEESESIQKAQAEKAGVPANKNLRL